MQLDITKIKEEYEGKFDLIAAYHISWIESYLELQKKSRFINKWICRLAVNIHYKKLRNHGLLQRRRTNERPEPC
jgi:hypothetical protein